MKKESDFGTFTSFFPDLQLPVSLGGRSLCDLKAFPKGGLPARDEETGSLYDGEDPATELLALGRIYPERELVHLIIMK